MKNKILPIIAIVLLVAAAGVCLYPTVSQWINQMLSQSEIVRYNNIVKTLSAETKNEQLSKAKKYNKNLSETISDSFSPDAFESNERYLNILNITENGQIGTINIPSIDCRLPIYHGSGKEMLTKGAVHLAGTAFPIGGASTHSVISAHTAYPGKVFFDKLTEVQIGDEFYVSVLGDILYYKVTDIKVVLPDETEYLKPERGKDLITLVTCTPYSVNTHRLLVTGKRTKAPRVKAEKTENTQVVYGNPIVYIIPICAVIVIVSVLALKMRRRKKKIEK